MDEPDTVEVGWDGVERKGIRHRFAVHVEK